MVRSMVVAMVLCTCVLMTPSVLGDTDPSSSDQENEYPMMAVESAPVAQALTAAAERSDTDDNIENTSASDKAEAETLPQPEAFISRNRMPDLRDRLIGMTFLGQPVPLGHRPRRRPFANDERPKNPGIRRMDTGGRRRLVSLPRNREATRRSDVDHELLRPVQIKATRAGIIFPDVPPGLSPSRHRQSSTLGFSNARRPFPRNERRPFRNYNERDIIYHDEEPFPAANSNSFDIKKELKKHTGFDIQKKLNDLSSFDDSFGNSVTSEFGPVVFEFDSSPVKEDADSFHVFDSSKIPHPDPGQRDVFRQHRFPITPRPPFLSSKPFSNINRPERPHELSHDSKSQCRRYTETICLDADNYPHSEILASLEGDKSRTDVLIAEVRDQSADDLVDGVSARQEERYNYSHYFGGNINRRQDTSPHRDFADDGGYLCPSEVKYARPKKAKNSKGEWKFIVNMDKYTQTIRMEKCLKPGGACSYISHHYQAMCNQIHNYQRLLAWEKKRGLHMDIFKVPSCCTCHIQGYSFVFPPLNDKKKPQHNPGTSANNGSPFSNPPRSRPQHPSSFNRVRRPNSPLNNEIRRLDYEEGNTNVQRVRPRNVTGAEGSRSYTVQDSFRRQNTRVRPRTRSRIEEPTERMVSNANEPEIFMEDPDTFVETPGGAVQRMVPVATIRLSDVDGHDPILDMDQNVESSDTSLTFVAEAEQPPDTRPSVIGDKQVNYDYHPIVQFFDGYQ